MQLEGNAQSPTALLESLQSRRHLVRVVREVVHHHDAAGLSHTFHAPRQAREVVQRTARLGLGDIHDTGHRHRGQRVLHVEAARDTQVHPGVSDAKA